MNIKITKKNRNIEIKESKDCTEAFVANSYAKAIAIRAFHDYKTHSIRENYIEMICQEAKDTLSYLENRDDIDE